MKKRTYIIVLFLLSFCQGIGAQEHMDLPAMYDALCTAIDSVGIYDKYHLDYINQIKARECPPDEELEKCQKLFEAYEKFSYDSASVYLNRCVQLAQQGNPVTQQKMQLLQARYYVTAGLFYEANHALSQICADSLSENLLSDYYNVKRFFYSEAGPRLRNGELRDRYWREGKHYLALVLETRDSTAYLSYFLREQEALEAKNYAEALYCNERQLQMVKPDTPDYSWVTFYRSTIYLSMGDTEREQYWLILSSISDIRCAIKDQASLWRLARIQERENNERLSFRLTQATYEATLFFNSSLRYGQIVYYMSFMEHKYQQSTASQNARLRYALVALSIMALLLLLSLLYIWRQMKRLNAARLQLRTANNDLKQLNKQLSSTLDSLAQSHHQLADSNTVKDVYIGRFLSLCSDYITKMEAFRQTVLKKGKSGQLEEYLSTSRMREIKATEVAEFMNDFDKAFLHIVPHFIEDFNCLLRPEARITPREPQTLTTELRIFALIRLGINDSSKIAEFLHYSVQTIYNYRSMVKNNALCTREEFEDRVREIGT